MKTVVANPFLFGFLILVFEAICNILLSLLFGGELGNFSGILYFLLAGMVVAYTLKQKMSVLYNCKVLGTYMAVVLVLVLLSLLGSESSVSFPVLFIVALFTLFVGLLSYAFFVLGQIIILRSLEKNINKETVPPAPDSVANS